VRRQVISSIIRVHKRPVHDGDTLEDVLQTLGKIVAVAQRGAGVEDDIDLDVELVAGVVGLQALDLADGLGEAHGQVQQHVALVRRGREARQILDMLERRLGPVPDDD
jgi:hypothetical protein